MADVNSNADRHCGVTVIMFTHLLFCARIGAKLFTSPQLAILTAFS
jgi:hypothetical protein